MRSRLQVSGQQYPLSAGKGTKNIDTLTQNPQISTIKVQFSELPICNSNKIATRSI